MTSKDSSSHFIPALIVVDLQEDFCPPHGSVALSNGREIVPIVNKLLDLPFALKIASKDWHPDSHVSFASNHSKKEPYVENTAIVNPQNPQEKKLIRLWPNHCIAGTFGAQIVTDLDIKKVDVVIEKGIDEDTEMYSVFYDIWGKDSGLMKILKERQVTDLWVVGLALDYCVKETAIHAAMEGIKTKVLKEATRATYDADWSQIEEEVGKFGVKLVSINDEEFTKILDCKT